MASKAVGKIKKQLVITSQKTEIQPITKENLPRLNELTTNVFLATVTLSNIGIA